MDILGKSIPGRGNSKCKGPEVALVCLQNNDKANVDRME